MLLDYVLVYYYYSSWLPTEVDINLYLPAPSSDR